MITVRIAHARPWPGYVGDGKALNLTVWVRCAPAVRLATMSARIASTCPSRPRGAPAARPDRAARAALTASSGSCPCGAVLPVGAVHLDDPDAGRGDIAGQAAISVRAWARPPTCAVKRATEVGGLHRALVAALRGWEREQGWALARR
jgi:hypothetical protein